MSSGASSRDVVGTELTKRWAIGSRVGVRDALRSSRAAEDALSDAMMVVGVGLLLSCELSMVRFEV